MTLAQGIAEYHLRNPDLLRGGELSAEAREWFRCHDATHVIFGCGRSLPDEAVVKLASVFGTTAGVAALRGYRLHEAARIYRQLPFWEVLGAVALAPLLVAATLIRCARQKKRWPWSGFSRHIETPLGALRAEYGVRVAGFRPPR